MTLEKIPLKDTTIAPGLIPSLTDASPLEIFVNQKDDRTHVALMGELDLATAPFVAKRLQDATTESQEDLVIDISLLTYIGSTGLSLLISQHKALQARGRSLTILNPTPMAQRLFQITGLTQILTIEPNPRPC